MLLVPTRTRPSSIHGLGLFTDHPIPQGTPLWRFDPGFDQVFSSTRLLTLPEPARAHIRWFAFLSPADGGWVLSGDHACFMNHDPRPNTGAIPGSPIPVTTVALRDIAANEELTCDYFAFDAGAAAKLQPLS